MGGGGSVVGGNKSFQRAPMDDEISVKFYYEGWEVGGPIIAAWFLLAVSLRSLYVYTTTTIATQTNTIR